MPNCPINHDTPLDNESEKHSQFYTFDLEKERGTIATFIDGEKRDFVIGEYFPILNDEGKVILALLAKTGYFSGYFYNFETNDVKRSDIFIFFKQIGEDMMTKFVQARTSDQLLKIFYPQSPTINAGSILLGESFTSEIFGVIAKIIKPSEKGIDKFKAVNDKILENSEGNWQKVYRFWSEYLDIKKRMFNLVKHNMRENLNEESYITQDKVVHLVQRWINRLCELIPVSLEMYHQAQITQKIEVEASSAIAFLRDHSYLNDPSKARIMYKGHNISKSIHFSPVTPTGQHLGFSIYTTLENLADNWVYCTLNPPSLSHCPVRRMLILG